MKVNQVLLNLAGSLAAFLANLFLIKSEKERTYFYFKDGSFFLSATNSQNVERRLKLDSQFFMFLREIK